MKKATIYRTNREKSLFEEDFTRQALSKLGNPLERLSEQVDFEIFRPVLEEALVTKECKTAAGRKRIDVVLMFKVIVLQRYYGLGDHQIEYQIVDRTSFRQFLNINTVDDVPDEKTVWACRESLTKDGTFDKLFDQFHKHLEDKGLIFNEGKIIDASFVETPKQRNTREENKEIKDGNGDKLWQAKESDSEEDRKHLENKRRHKDIDARWTMKRGVAHYGYKLHAKVDSRTKLIDTYHTTANNVHDSKVIKPLIRESDKGQKLRLDGGYAGKDEEVRKNGMIPVICEKGYRGHPLTEEQKKSNREKSKVRCRVEHAFGFMEQTMGGLVFRNVGMMRAKASNALTCLVYNICRYEQLVRCQPKLVESAASKG